MLHKFFSDTDTGFWRFYCPTRLFSLKQADSQYLVKICGSYGSRIGIVTDETVSSLNAFQQLKTALSRYIVEQAFIEPGTSQQSIERAAQSFKAKTVDLIVAIGGGTVLDGAKLVRSLLQEATSLDRILEANKPTTPLLCIPTTFGTGSEINCYTHYTRSEDGVKIALKHDHFTPDAAALIPDFAAEASEKIRYLGGIDAFCHVLEALLLTRERNPLSDAIGQQAIRHLLTHFTDYLAHPTLQSIQAVATTSTIGGILLNNARTGLIHSLATGLAQLRQLEHSESLLPFILPVVRLHLETEPATMEELLGGVSLSTLESIIIREEDHPLVMTELSEEETRFIIDCVNNDVVLQKECPYKISNTLIRKILDDSQNRSRH